VGIVARIGGDGTLFIGEDKKLTFEILDPNGVPVDLTSWTTRFVVRLHFDSVTAEVDEPGVVSGVYNANRSLNTQRVSVTLEATDLDFAARTYFYSLRRTDTGFAAVLRSGEFKLEDDAG
jgi:hypothetical protein